MSLIFAELSLRFVENPVRFGEKFKRKSPQWIVGVSLLISVIIFGATYSLIPLEKILGKRHPEGILKQIEERPLLPKMCNSVTSESLSHCQIPFSQDTSSVLYVWGDSHVYAMTNFYYDVAKSLNADLVIRSHSAMVPLLGQNEIYQEGKPRPYDIFETNQRVFEDLKKMALTNKKIRLILASRWQTYLGIKPISVKDFRNYLDQNRTQEGSLDVFEKKLRETLEKIRSLGINEITFLLSPPEFQFETKRCIREEQCQIGREEFLNYRQPGDDILLKVSREYEVSIIDPVKFLCNEKACPQILNIQGEKIPVVYDDDHLTPAASRYFAKQWLMHSMVE